MEDDQNSQVKVISDDDEDQFVSNKQGPGRRGMKRKGILKDDSKFYQGYLNYSC